MTTVGLLRDSADWQAANVTGAFGKWQAATKVTASFSQRISMSVRPALRRLGINGLAFIRYKNVRTKALRCCGLVFPVGRCVKARNERPRLQQ